MPAEPITSTANPRLKGLVRLRERRERDRSGLFLIEGYRELRRALDGGISLAEVWCCPALYLGQNEAALVEAARARGAEIVEVAEAPFRKASYRDRPEGLLAVARQFPTGLDRLDLGPAPLLLVVEGIEKPGNLGTMMRTAEAAGAAALIVCDPTTDPFNPNVVRASLGTLFSLPLAVADTPDTIAWLHGRGIRTVATTPSATQTPLGGRPHRGGRRGRGQRAVRPLDRLAPRGDRAGAHPDAGDGGQPERRHGRRRGAVRGGAAAPLLASA